MDGESKANKKEKLCNWGSDFNKDMCIGQQKKKKWYMEEKHVANFLQHSKPCMEKEKETQTRERKEKKKK